VFLIPFEQRFLFGLFDQPHAAALESELRKFGLGNLKEDIDNGVTETANLEFFHDVYGFSLAVSRRSGAGILLRRESACSQKNPTSNGAQEANPHLQIQ
jgi:hypothetical protein